MAPNCGNPIQTGPEAVEKVSNRADSFYHTDQASPQDQASTQNRNLSSNNLGRMEIASGWRQPKRHRPLHQQLRMEVPRLGFGCMGCMGCFLPILQLMATGQKKPCQNNLPRRLLTSISSRGITNAFGVNPPPSTISQHILKVNFFFLKKFKVNCI